MESQKRTTFMEAADVIALYLLLEAEGITVWLDGGWAVDALLGEQTRPHTDLDIVIQDGDIPKLRELLEDRGYKDIERDDTSAWNFVLGDNTGREVDVHAIMLDNNGNGVYGPAQRGVVFPADSLTGSGEVSGKKVRCISAVYMVRFISPWLFKRREKNIRDVSALCDRFGVPYPEELRAVT